MLTLPLSLHKPSNEPILDIRADDTLWQAHAKGIAAVPAQFDIPMIVGGAELRSNQKIDNINPCTGRPMGTVEQANSNHASQAVAAALAAKPAWAALSPASRIQKFRDLEAVLVRWRWETCGITAAECGFTATELAASWAEMIDFLRFNSWYYSQILSEQLGDGPMETNAYNWRPLKGFCCAVTPFNFPIAIGFNLPLVMALTGNTVVWKPSDDATLTSYLLMRALDEAGFPPGVINMITGDGKPCLPTVLAHPELACLNFTGSFSTARALAQYLYGESFPRPNFPRLVAETGGKDFLVADRDIDVDDTAACIVAGAFGRSGQKCSANSVLFAHADIWPKLRDALVERTKALKMTNVSERDADLGPVINKRAYDRIARVLAEANQNPGVKKLCGGSLAATEGYYIPPTIYEVTARTHDLLSVEVFGPVLAVQTWTSMDSVFETMNSHNYRLTGSVISRNESFLDEMVPKLSHYAGNLYVNRKTTGAVVDQQPFGGDGASGTNCKAGSRHYLLNFLSPATITRRHTRFKVGSPF